MTLDFDAATSEPKGIGSYPEYAALWPLQRVGVFDGPDFTSTIWDMAEAQDPATVALIDTTVAWDHPCLRNSVDLVRMVDFSIAREGAFVVPFQDLSPEQQTLRTDFRANVAPHIQDDAPLKTAVHSAFSAHGTAMAGLIAGHTGRISLHVPAQINLFGAVSQAGSVPELLPFAGVNPFCRLVPISTTSEPNPETLMAAFNYADAIDADVIVFATVLSDPSGVSETDPNAVPPPEPLSGAQIEQDRIGSQAYLAAHNALKTSLENIGKRRFIVCAAGNSGQIKTAFPASLSAMDNKIISVGARNSEDQAVPYSAEADVYGPSGDEPRLDTEAYRQDPFTYEPLPNPLPPQERASHLALISTDVPGPYGYNPSDIQYQPRKASDLNFDIGSLFCRFSGTSGASAVVGGMLALALQANRAGLKGKSDFATGTRRILTMADLFA